MEETKIPFRPVKCLEEDIEKLAPIEGYVLFTTDTKKIYACVDGEYKMMGGSSGVYYANKNLTDEEKWGDQVIFSFLHSDIDGTNLPAVDDLILNIPDGGFYRTLNVSSTDIQAQRIAISGGGSGGGGSGDASTEGTLAIEFIYPEKGRGSTITGVDYYLEFNIVAKDALGNDMGDREEGIATWLINGQTYTSRVYPGKNTFKVDQYLDPTLSENKIILNVSMNTGGMANKTANRTFYIKAVDLKLEWDWTYSAAKYITGEDFTLTFTPYGGVDCQAHIIFDDTRVLNETYYINDIKSFNTGREVVSSRMKALEYGAHTCEIYLTTEVNGEEYKTPSIFNEITFTSGKSSTILTVPYYKEEATQYDTLNIPFLVYDPDQESVDVSFYINDIRVGGDTYDRNLHYWPYTLSNYGSIKLTIMSDNEEARHDIELVVNKLDLNVSEADGYKFSLKANNFSSNSEIKDWNQNGVSLRFSDGIQSFNGIIPKAFDWQNGGLKTETLEDGSIQKYICVRQGTRMEINYQPFNNQSIKNQGLDFKICFKATNCYDYEAPILNCFDDASQIGLTLDAQKAYFAAASTNLTTQYYENSYIELETEIWPTVQGGSTLYPDNPGDRFLMFWVDGVPVGVKAYTYGSEYFVQTNPKTIIIGSDLCDVYVYLVKVYERKLTENEHLDNFIMDSPNTNEMLDRYRRNDIIDNSGEISYEKLVQKNPDCHAYVYRIPRMTTSKNDKVKNCDYFELFGEYNTINNPYYKASGVQTYVQGTSSAAYGVAAFNLRSKFGDGLIDKDGNQVDGWKVSETAIPIELACTKVNVASCENANNVVNAEWYNKFQPYHDGHRRKTREDGNVYRDCMEFNSGVVFVLDENTETNWHDDSGKPSRDKYLNANVFSETYNYTTKPYYKMYAIGNMGNDKKNSEVFHDITNNKACCIEVTDNQNAEHHMTIPTDLGTFDLEDLFYEFRYPDGNDDPAVTLEMKQGWVDFVNWMAASNPKGGNKDYILTKELVNLTTETYKPNTYYIYDASRSAYVIASDAFNSGQNYYNIIPAADGDGISVAFDSYTFKGFDPPGFKGQASPTGKTLKGTTIHTYAGTYTKDSYEYRMAKMLAECEEHLVMDSIIFHYLYIQRHTMVDNVAKNTFWSSEDCQHWDLTKNYDNDTSDGNNNSGYLTYTYGIEPYDMELDDKGQPKNVFNASESVWLNFAHGLYDAQKELYQSLWNIVEGEEDRIKAWSAKDYLNEFKKHQNPIPERCWIYDYFRKYIRPRRLGLDENTYLNRLEGGKKTHQRTQYETYQGFYIDSKYIAGTSFNQSTSIDMRLNANPEVGWNEDYIIPISFYIDCYSSSLIGGRSDYSGTRIKRGDIYNIPVGKLLTTANDSTCYIYGGSMVQTLTGLSTVYPNYAVLSEAGKLREIELGSDEPGYYNANLENVTLGSNKMLQNVYVQNSGKSEGFDVDLTNAVQLKELKLNGSTANILKLADGSVVELLYLNGLQDLTMTNATMLRDIRVDNEIYDNLRFITVKNCPAFDNYSYQIALKSPIQQYVFNDFIWTITENTSEHFVLENGEVKGLVVLDKLLAANPKLDYTTATALIGTIKIDVDCVVDEYEIYAKYSKQYPNLIIEYTNKVSGLDPAVELKFMAGDSVASAIHYRVLGSGDGDVSIGTLISAKGPTGTAITDPSKGNTSQYTYTFTGYWLYNNQKYYVNGLESPEEGAINFDSVSPTESMVFIPEFKEEIRKHEIKFYDYDGNVILQNGKETFGVPYGSTYRDANGPLTNYWYLDSSKLPLDRRYGFQGWSTARFKVDEGRNMEYVDLDTQVITKAMNLYPYYITEDVYSVPTNPNYFQLIGRELVLKDEYRASLAGKITIPDVTGASIVGGMNNNPEITHVFFLRGSTQYTAIGSSAFMNAKKLQEIILPDSITSIGANAFQSADSLININLHDNITEIGSNAFSATVMDDMKVNISKLPANLIVLGSGAFQRAGPNITISELPKGIVDLQSFVFHSCPNVVISEFGSDGTGSKLVSIGTQAFWGAGKGVSSITFNPSVKSISNGAFTEYGTGSLQNVYFANAEGDYDNSASGMGFDSSVNITYSYTG